VVAAACAGLLVLPALAHRGQRPREVQQRRKGTTERVLLALVGVAFLLALVWVATPLLRAADYAPRPAALVAGLLAYAAGLTLLYRSHRDLAEQWSVTLELKEGHALVTRGVYRRLRHPMYLALLLYGLGQALVLPNLVAGPAYLVATLALVGLRLGPEERMMSEAFGAAYADYVARTRRLVPGLW
jgi:protein-S-isoprenylcysteine O-methyltransferase Ste14